jgi:hypothetical protein
LFDLNSTTLRKIEKFDGKYIFNGFFHVCVKVHKKKFIKCNISLNPFVGIVEM